MHKLGINIDHIATLRQSRGTKYPDPVFAAMIAQNTGASNITIHIREDRRHAQERDLELLMRTINIKVNLEMAATEDLLAIALKHKPESSTIVPEKRLEVTTEGGIDLLLPENAYLKDYIKKLKDGGVEVSLFIDAEINQIDKSKELGAQAVEFNTGRYCDAITEKQQDYELEKLKRAIEYAREQHLKAHVGHGINYNNVQKLAALGTIEEFNIGHAIVSRAVFSGLERAIRDMLELLGILR